MRAAHYVQTLNVLVTNCGDSRLVIENEKYAMDIQKMTKAHLIHIMFETCYNDIQERAFKDEKVREVMLILVTVFGFKQLSEDT